MRILRADLQSLVEALVAEHGLNGEMTLDALGHAVGVRAVSAAEIDGMIDALESRGVKVTSPKGSSGEVHLKAVVAAARVLSAERGRPATVDEIADQAGLDAEAVRHALTLLKIMQR